MIIKKGGANTTNQIRIRIRPAPSSKQIKIREYEYEPSCRIREYGQPVANTNTSPGYVFIWLYLLYLYVTLALRASCLGQCVGHGVRAWTTRSPAQTTEPFWRHTFVSWKADAFAMTAKVRACVFLRGFLDTSDCSWRMSIRV